MDACYSEQIKNTGMDVLKNSGSNLSVSNEEPAVSHILSSLSELAGSQDIFKYKFSGQMF